MESPKTIPEIVEELNKAQDALRICYGYICGIDEGSIHLRVEYFQKICAGAPVRTAWGDGTYSHSLHLFCEKDGRNYVTVIQ